MRQIYESEELPGYLDSTAQRLLAEARANYRNLGISSSPIFAQGNTTWIFPWKGDRVMNTLSVLFTTHGVKASRDGAALSLPVTTPEETSRILESLLSQPLPDPVRLAAFVSNKEQDKYDEYLGEDLLNASYAARDLDLPGAWSTLEALTR
jgi:ATP-dependent Lhr-like helicase